MKKLLVALSLIAAAILPTRSAYAANILQFADNPTSCGGSVLCSTNGTSGYSGTQAYNLSTINQWFQIDTDGVSHLAGQTVEPNGSAGQFLVLNDTGALLNSFSITFFDSVTSSTPSAAACGSTYCAKFTIHDGAMHDFNTLSITGAACVTSCGTASATASSGLVTYTWSNTDPTKGLAAGATALLTFSGWNNTIYAPAVPEPSTWAMMLLGFGAIGFGRSRQLSRVSRAN